MCEAIVPVLLKLSQERFLRKQFLAKARVTLCSPTPATFPRRALTQDLSPRSCALLCLRLPLPMRCFGYPLCCGGSHLAWPVRAVHFQRNKLSFQQRFPPCSLTSLSGCPRYQVSVTHSPGLRSSLRRAESCAGRETGLR